MAMTREVAWRVFAGEFNASTHELPGADERSPSYLLSPIGAKINRVFAIGIISDVENIGSISEPLWRAMMVDPTGTFFISAGQYQPEAAQALAAIKPPVFAAIIGKTRAYRPDSGQVYLSIRPETVKVVDSASRDYWVLETCKLMQRRIEATRLALGTKDITVENLVAQGVRKNLAEGAVLAVQTYGKVDIERYAKMHADALKYLVPEIKPEEELKRFASEPQPTEDKKDEADEIEEKVLAIITALDTTVKGVAYDKINSRAKKDGIDKDAVEDAINALMDKGLIYEPALGQIKRVQ